MRLHVIGLPHTQTTSEYNQCAYTAKATRFCSMMTDLGHDVILYASEENEARCAELVTCITREAQAALIPPGEVYEVNWDDSLEFWRHFTGRALGALYERVQPQDFICLTVGWPYRELAAAFPNNIVVETGVGYEGVLDSSYRVFESYAWMHTVYGKGGPMAMNGRSYDTVIPNFYDVDDFPLGLGAGDYYAFMSRAIGRKGFPIAIRAAMEAGAELRVGGAGGDRVEANHVTYLGYLDPRQRAELLGGAIATFVPTQYIEPFGGVAVESMLCGTPVITSDFGAFTETVRHEVDGFRCHTMQEYVDAAQAAKLLERTEIRATAIARFSTEAVGWQYNEHFDRLMTLWGDGFYEGVPHGAAW